MWAVTASQWNKRKDGVTGLGPFSSSISLSCRDRSCVLRLKYCALFESNLQYLSISSVLFSCIVLCHPCSYPPYKGNGLHELHAAAPLSLSFPPWTALCCTAPVHPHQSWCISPADNWICYFMLITRYLCLMAFSKLHFCHKNSTYSLSHRFLSRGKLFFLSTIGPAYGPSWINKICFIILSWPLITR